MILFHRKDNEGGNFCYGVAAAFILSCLNVKLDKTVFQNVRVCLRLAEGSIIFNVNICFISPYRLLHNYKSGIGHRAEQIKKGKSRYNREEKWHNKWEDIN